MIEMARIGTRRLLLFVSLLIGVVGWGCAAQRPTAAEQVTRGRQLYAAHCARCHGDQGEGKRGPALIGPHYAFSGRGTARGLYDYVSKVMPFDAPGTLKEEEHWAILAFILNRNDLLGSDTVLSSENAESIPLVRR